MSTRFPMCAWAACFFLMLTQPAVAAAPDLDQNWPDRQVKLWYELTQGSRLIPLDWLAALEQAGSTEPFLSKGNIRRFGYEPYEIKSDDGKRVLTVPLGFAVDRADDHRFKYTRLRWFAGQKTREPWLGMTCAACHTGKITYQGAALTIQGGATGADFQSFFDEYRAALAATAHDEAKFARFSGRVLAGKQDAGLRDALETLLAFELENARMNHTALRYGPGRLDAVGHILNKVVQVSGIKDPPPKPANAPVSYPFLWNIPQHDKVQWNGMAGNHPVIGGVDLGALGRNTGEVIGVFGELVPGRRAEAFGYVSSLDATNMIALERMLDSLRPPRWPSTLFGEPSTEHVDAGRLLFKERCAGCHAVLDRTDLKTPIEAQMIHLVEHDGRGPIGTDPLMACNAYNYTSPTGAARGENGADGTPLEDTEKVLEILTVYALKAIAGQGVDVAKNVALGFFGVHPDIRPTPWHLRLLHGTQESLGLISGQERRIKTCETTNNKILAYKGRPLNGIWATPPYLHNGSVASLYELLLPPGERKPFFHTGTTEFDPKNVGFMTEPDAPGNWFKLDTTLPGNRATGHEYGTDLKDPQRRALVEYMKTL